MSDKITIGLDAKRAETTGGYNGNVTVTAFGVKPEDVLNQFSLTDILAHFGEEEVVKFIEKKRRPEPGAGPKIMTLVFDGATGMAKAHADVPDQAGDLRIDWLAITLTEIQKTGVDLKDVPSVLLVTELTSARVHVKTDGERVSYTLEQF